MEGGGGQPAPSHEPLSSSLPAPLRSHEHWSSPTSTQTVRNVDYKHTVGPLIYTAEIFDSQCGAAAAAAAAVHFMHVYTSQRLCQQQYTWGEEQHCTHLCVDELVSDNINSHI